MALPSVVATFGEPTGQGWTQIGELGLAFVLSALIGLEREVRQKSAGVRTHTLVGFAAALIVIVSKYGFTDVVSYDRVILDPSRVAAQIVSGIGFIGGGLIFVRRDAVKGLTTAAVVWLTAAVGMAAGAGLPLLAILVTAGHFAVVFGFTPLARRLPQSRLVSSQLRMTYWDGYGVLRRALVECTHKGFTVSQASVERDSGRPWRGRTDQRPRDGRNHDAEPPDLDMGRAVSVTFQLVGSEPVVELVSGLSEMEGVVSVSAGEVDETAE